MSQRLVYVLSAGALAVLGAARPAFAHPNPPAGHATPAFQSLFAPDDPRAAPVSRAWAHLFKTTQGDAGDAAGRLVLSHPWAEYAPEDPVATAPPGVSSQPSITWGPLLWQSLEYLVLQHSVRAGFEKNTWQKTIEGPFWDDYVNSVKNLCCWEDGDKVTTNYLFHPLMGSAAAFVFANNHRGSMATPAGMTRAYWDAKAKQGLYALAYSTYFEIGPVLSEAAIGNIGLSGEGMTWQDIVITPAMGLAISVGEDALRATLIDRLDRWNHFWGATAAIFLNPTRSFANLLAFKIPWADPPWLTLRREAAARGVATVAAGGR